MNTIIEEVKAAIGVGADNFSFDAELLMTLNAAKSMLVQQGVTEIDIDIDEATAWPVFNSDVVGELSKQYLVMKTKLVFDPTASETIHKTLSDYTKEVEARIRHEVEEVADV